jgi:uncharacterized protein (DUF305 family)
LTTPDVPRFATAAVAGLALVVLAVFVTHLATHAHAPSAKAPSAVDVGFAQDMIVHHQQAVLMASYTREHAGTDDVRALAGTIDAAQQREIGQMTGWLQSWGKPVQSDRLPMTWMGSAMPDHAHLGNGTASMPGMASAADMDRLVNLTGNPLDVRFLTLMTRHHEGGLPMAKYAALHARLAYVRDTARMMIQDQQREIDLMGAMLEARTQTG